MVERKEAADRIEELEAKLAKAVEHFKKLRRRQDCLETYDAVVDEVVETALTELKGGKDALRAENERLRAIALDYRHILHSAKTGRDLHCGMYVAKEYHFTRDQIDAALLKIEQALIENPAG